MLGFRQLLTIVRDNLNHIATVVMQVAILIGVIDYCLPLSIGKPARPNNQLEGPTMSHTIDLEKSKAFSVHGSSTSTSTGYMNAFQREGSGVVVDSWRADTDANRRACLSTWLFDHAHESFCIALRHTIILAVRVSDPVNEHLIYMPTSQNFSVSTGDHIFFSRGFSGSDLKPGFVPVVSARLPGTVMRGAIQ